MNTTSETKLASMEIYDPAMCLPSGVCGQSIDPALLDINGTMGDL
jgi:hypothetical protein